MYYKRNINKDVSTLLYSTLSLSLSIYIYMCVCEVHSSRTLSKKSCTRFSSSQLGGVYWWFFCIYFISKDMLICIFKDGPGKFLTSTLESQRFQVVIHISLDVSRKLYIWVWKFPGRYTSIFEFPRRYASILKIFND